MYKLKKETTSSKSYQVMLRSAGEDGDERHCRLTIQFGYTYYSMRLPNIIKPYKKEHKYKGNTFYTNETRSFGGYYSPEDHYIHVSYGIDCGDSSVDQDWGWFLPWLEWKHIRTSKYGKDGKELPQRQLSDFELENKNIRRVFESEDVPEELQEHFLLSDYDDEIIPTSIYTVEREWTRGTGWWSWLRFLYKNQTHRTIEIRFHKETGKRKGSWKGGTIGTGFMLNSQQTPKEALDKYCDSHDMEVTSELTSEKCEQLCYLAPEYVKNIPKMFQTRSMWERLLNKDASAIKYLDKSFEYYSDLVEYSKLMEI